MAKIGKVVRIPLSAQHNFGYIKIAEAEVQIFFRSKDIEPTSLPLKLGDEVIFELCAGQDGLCGLDVRKVKHVPIESGDAQTKG